MKAIDAYIEWQDFLVNSQEHYRDFVGRQRYGQFLFNSLYEIAPNIANEIRGSVADPFYRDSMIVHFLFAVESYFEQFDEMGWKA